MDAEIIAVGSELLLGQISNTNGQYLSAELAGIGINVYRHTVVGDNKKRLLSAMKEASQRADVIFMSGGLGPTEDDLTKDAVAEWTSSRLLYHEETLNHIKQVFKDQKKPMPDNNKKQALYTEGSEVFYNKAGLACGMVKEHEGCLLFLLPGPPRELKAMFKNDVRPYLLKKLGGESLVLSRVLRFFGIGESMLEEKIIDVIQSQTNPTIAPLASDGEVTVRLTAKAKTRDEANFLLDRVEKEIAAKVGDYLYGKNEETLPVQVIHHLKEQGLTLSAAESLTGGWFAKLLVDTPGASSVLEGSATVYSSKAKERILNIEPELIQQFGTVSKECAEMLAENVRHGYGTDIGISFTGVAGPDPLEGKRPGTVWIGIAGPRGTTSHLLNLSGSREYIRLLAVYYGCWFLLKEKVVTNDIL